MLRRLSAKSLIVFAVGISTGLLVGVGMMIGAVVATRLNPAQVNPAQLISFPERMVHATASHGGETMAMATGAISDGVEGLFLLDYLTGDIQCLVVNPKTGQLGGVFKHNVIADLGATGKKPSYIMVTGVANWQTVGGSIKPADCVVYVADSNTGAWAAYSLPWNRNRANFNAAQLSTMTRIGQGLVRDPNAFKE